VIAPFTHAVWVPDSTLGPWEHALAAAGIPLVRVCREGEAMVLAAGLLLGGARPLVIVQCTGFFEAGDAVRNVVHDLKLPLKIVVGVRSWNAVQAGKSSDNCPTFTEPIVRAWQLPVAWANPLAMDWAAYADLPGPGVLLWPE
jgi:hypothetical protein